MDEAGRILTVDHCVDHRGSFSDVFSHAVNKERWYHRGAPACAARRPPPPHRPRHSDGITTTIILCAELPRLQRRVLLEEGDALLNTYQSLSWWHQRYLISGAVCAALVTCSCLCITGVRCHRGTCGHLRALVAVGGLIIHRMIEW